MTQPATTPSANRFPTTQWTEIIEAIQQGDRTRASAALADFCCRYRPAIVEFFRQRGCSPDRAEDCAQEFFRSGVIEGWEQQEGFLYEASRKAGAKFRSFLSRILWRFLQDEWKKERAAKAGRGALE
jgi:DNA-directed RNA polymerase specialized sigma24 family protein